MGAAGPLVMLLGRFGWRGILLAVIILVAARYMTCNESSTTSPSTTQVTAPAAGASEEKLRHFTAFVFDDTQEHWQKQLGDRYQDAKMVLYRDGVESACGLASSATGPFYCPLDQKVYLDLSFYDDLRERFGAQGDFAQAYVIAHEMGHHVQNLRGVLDTNGSNQASVKTELQADCLAGVWGASAQKREMLDAGDLEEAINAAAAIGDDRIQRQTSGEIRPESFTHGSSAQRARAFRTGFQRATAAACE